MQKKMGLGPGHRLATLRTTQRPDQPGGKSSRRVSPKGRKPPERLTSVWVRSRSQKLCLNLLYKSYKDNRLLKPLVGFEPTTQCLLAWQLYPFSHCGCWINSFNSVYITIYLSYSTTAKIIFLHWYFNLHSCSRHRKNVSPVVFEHATFRFEALRLNQLSYAMLLLSSEVCII